MKKWALAFAATAAFAGQAVAADMAVKARPLPQPVPVANWTGCYIGGGGGYGLFDQENTGYLEPIPGGALQEIRAAVPAFRTRYTETVDTGGRGWFGTVNGGCDYQFALGGWQMLVGAFGDYDFADIKGNHNPPGTPFWAREKMSDAWAVGGRIGWIVTPNLLTYFSGGYTEAKFSQQNYTNLIGPPFGIGTGLFTGERWYQGWFLGSGVEYALNFLPGLYWKTEYRFSEFDVERNPLRFTATGLPTFYSEDSKKYVQTVRSSLVWHFNWGKTPVVAKY